MAKKGIPRLRKNSHFRSLHDTGFYRSWCAMKARCHCPTSYDYSRYGGRGICVSQDWHDFSNFYQDMYESWGEHRRAHLSTTLERIDVDANYSKENCRWATRQEQSNNRRHHNLIQYDGETHNLNQWARKLGIKRSTLAQRIYVYKWPVERALTT